MPGSMQKIPDDFVVSLRFVVMLGETMFGFSKVSNISSNIDYEVIQEGGLNDFTYALPKPATDVQKLIFERGYRLSGKVPPLAEGGWPDKAGVICILGKNRKVIKTFGFTSAYISKWEITDFSAESSNLLYEKVELIHNGLRELNSREFGQAVRTINDAFGI